MNDMQLQNSKALFSSPEKADPKFNEKKFHQQANLKCQF
jgi:hypothetical protein